MLKQWQKKNKTSGTSFDEGYIAAMISQLLDKKIITNVNFLLSSTKITFEIIFLFRWKKLY